MLIDVLNLLDLCKRSCHKENKSDWEKMRKEFKLLIEKKLKIRTKKTEGREDIKKSLTVELSKDGEQSGELGARHLLYSDMVNKSVNKRLTPDSLEFPNVNLKY
jgi:hypothetical protein